MKLGPEIRRLLLNKEVRRYSANTTWLLAEKGVAMLAALLVGTWVARYLGPARFGTLSYVVGVAILAKPILSLGLEGILSREMVRHPEESSELIATSTLLRSVASLLYVLFIAGGLYLVHRDWLYAALGVVVGIGHSLLMLSEPIQYYFRSRVEARLNVVPQIAGHLLGSGAKVAFILAGAGVVWLAIGNLIVASTTALLLWAVYAVKAGRFIDFNDISTARASSLLKESWPLIIAGTSNIVVLHIDTVMLHQMLGSVDVGIYTAAVRISTLFYFVPMLVGWSLQPAVIRAQQHSTELYRRRLRQILTGLTLLALCLTALIVVSSGQLVSLLYGSEYAQSAAVLRVHAWQLVVIFSSQTRSLAVITESHFKFEMLSGLLGGILNVAANLLLIPRFGAVGAAIATLVSYFFVHIGFGLLYKPMRWLSVEQIKTILIFGIFKHIRERR